MSMACRSIQESPLPTGVPNISLVAATVEGSGFQVAIAPSQLGISCGAANLPGIRKLR